METGVQGAAPSHLPVETFDDNAQDYAAYGGAQGGYGTESGHSNAGQPGYMVTQDGVQPQYEDGEESFDPTEFFNSFAPNQNFQQDGDSNQGQGQAENIDHDLQVSDSDGEEKENQTGAEDDLQLSESDNDNDDEDDFVDVDDSESNF